MPRFRFPLEALLKARQNSEQQCQRVVARIDQERVTLEDRLRRLQQEITRQKHDLQSHLVGPLDVSLLRGHAAVSLHGLRQAERLVLELAGVHRRLEQARAVLIEAARQRRAVERLRERRLEQWTHEQNLIEINAMDELAVIAAARLQSP